MQPATLANVPCTCADRIPVLYPAVDGGWLGAGVHCRPLWRNPALGCLSSYSRQQLPGKGRLIEHTATPVARPC